MHRTIWKFPIDIVDQQTIKVPAGSHIIHAGLDADDQPCVWAEVYPSAERISHTIFVRGTGQSLSFSGHNARHYGSFVQDRFVWHVYGSL